MKNVLFVMTLILSCQFAQAQERMNAGAQEKIKAYRIAFFDKKLNLSESEAEKFWPLYDSYTEKKRLLRQEERNGNDIALLTDQEVEQYLVDHLDREQQLLDLKKDFFRNAKTAFNVRKVALIPEVEKEFKKAILKEMRNRRAGQEGEGMERRRRFRQ